MFHASQNTAESLGKSRWRLPEPGQDYWGYNKQEGGLSPQAHKFPGATLPST